jgi:hypothetical protein
MNTPSALSSPWGALAGFRLSTAALLLVLLLGALLSSPAQATARLSSGARFLQQSASGPCVCTFDFDETLRIYGPNGYADHPADDGHGIIKACLVS